MSCLLETLISTECTKGTGQLGAFRQSNLDEMENSAVMVHAGLFSESSVRTSGCALLRQDKKSLDTSVFLGILVLTPLSVQIK